MANFFGDVIFQQHTHTHQSYIWSLLLALFDQKRCNVRWLYAYIKSLLNDRTALYLQRPIKCLMLRLPKWATGKLQKTISRDDDFRRPPLPLFTLVFSLTLRIVVNLVQFAWQKVTQKVLSEEMSIFQ